MYTDPFAANIFTIMPNPAMDYIVVKPGIVSGTATFLITDDNGRVYMRSQINATPKQIDVSALAKGTYEATIIQPGNINTQKLVIQ